ncbi:MAG: MerR family transcriptional regulator [Acidimicrobiia bacterium]
MSDHQSIGEVLATLRGEFPDITISKIRFLESQGLIDPERTPSGYRKFRDGDVARLRWILQQQKDNFLPLKVIKSRLDEVGPDGLPEDVEVPAAADPEPEPEPERPRAKAATKAAKAKAPRASKAEKPAKRAPARPSASEPTPMFETPTLPLDDGAEDDLAATISGASFTRSELATAAGLRAAQLTELEEYGLVAPAAGSGERVVFDEQALLVAQLAAAFAGHGIGPRHLRMFRAFAEREAGLYDQVIAPRLRRKNPEARAQAREDLVDLVRLGRSLRAAFLRDAAAGLLRD